MAIAAYRPLLADTQVRALLAGATVAGLSTGLTFAVILAVQAEHSIASAGLVAAVMTVADGALIPVRGRLVDRRGQGVLLPLALVHGLFLIALAAFVPSLPVWALCLLAAPAGMTNTPLFASLRALWRDVTTDEDELGAAYSLHAITNELLFVGGPLVVVAVAALFSARGAVIAVAVCQILGAAVFTATRVSRSWRGEAGTTGVFGALESAGMRTLAVTTIGIGFVVGTLDVAVVAFAREQGSAGAGGIALAGLAAGSAIGGLVYGARSWSIPVERRYVALCGLMLAGLVPLGAAGSMPALVALMAVAGLVLAPEIAVSFALIDRVAPGGTATESTTWLIAANGLGAAVGAAAAGQVAERAGAGWALELATAGAAFALLVALARVRTLRPR